MMRRRTDELYAALTGADYHDQIDPDATGPDGGYYAGDGMWVYPDGSHADDRGE